MIYTTSTIPTGRVIREDGTVEPLPADVAEALRLLLEAASQPIEVRWGAWMAALAPPPDFAAVDFDGVWRARIDQFDRAVDQAYWTMLPYQWCPRMTVQEIGRL